MLTRYLIKAFSPSALALLVAILVGCGGGGSGSDGTTTSGSSVEPGGTAGSDDSPQSITLDWAAPTERLDGSPIAMNELDVFRVYLGSTPDDLVLVAEIDDPYTMNYSISNLDPGTYYLYVTAVDSAGVESPPSEVVTATL
jgi:hypothetical protein